MSSIERVLVAPLNYSHRQRGQVEAFEGYFGKAKVHEIDWWGEHKRGHNAGAALERAAAEIQPDWIWLQVQGEGIPPDSIARIKARLPKTLITHWMGDCRLTVSDGLAALCRATDGTLISNSGQLEMYQRAGARRTAYVQIGLDPEDLVDKKPDFRVPDVVFIGNHYGHVDGFRAGTEERLLAIRTLKVHGIDVGVVGAGWPKDIPVVGTCHVKEQYGVYNRAKVALSISHFNNIPHYYSDRLLIAMASGTPVVARGWPCAGDEFALRGHEPDLLLWHDPADLVGAVSYLLENREAHRAIGNAGSRTVALHHSWIQRIADFVPTANQWRSEL